MILTLLVIAVDTLLELDEVPEDERTLAAAAVRVGLRTLAQYLAYLVPAAVFCGVFVSVASGARAREIVALKAGGVNPLVVLAPVLASGLVIGLALLGLQETAGVRAAAALAAATGVTRGEVTRSGAIWYHAGRVIYSAREADAEGKRAADVHVLERDAEGRLVRQIHAEQAQQLSAQQWRFERAVVRRFAPDDPTQPPQFERAESITLELAASLTPRLQPEELATLPLGELGEYVQSVLGAGGSPGHARFAFHQRASAPALALVFGMLAVPLALGIESGRALALQALRGVLWVGACFFLREAASGFSASGTASALWLPWSLLAGFLLLATIRLARTPR